MFFLADHNLTYTDTTQKTVEVEARVPYLNVELINFAAKISGNVRRFSRLGKWDRKKAMDQYLPKDVICKPKAGFGTRLRQ